MIAAFPAAFRNCTCLAISIVLQGEVGIRGSTATRALDFQVLVKTLHAVFSASRRNARLRTITLTIKDSSRVPIASGILQSLLWAVSLLPDGIVVRYEGVPMSVQTHLEEKRPTTAQVSRGEHKDSIEEFHRVLPHVDKAIQFLQCLNSLHARLECETIQARKGILQRSFLPVASARFSDDITLRRLQRLEQRAISIGSIETLDTALRLIENISSD